MIVKRLLLDLMLMQVGTLCSDAAEGGVGGKHSREAVSVGVQFFRSVGDFQVELF